MENAALSNLYKNPAHKRGAMGEFVTAEKLAAYHAHGWLKMDEPGPRAVEPVKQAISNKGRNK